VPLKPDSPRHDLDAVRIARPTEDAPRSRLDRALVRGVAWSGVASALTQALSWASTLVVVHLLEPSDYGVVGIAQIFLGLAALLSEFGIGSAIVALRSLGDRQIAQLSSVAWLLGFAALAVSWALAKPFSRFFDDERLVVLIMVSAVGLLASAAGCVATAVLQRDLEFRYLARAYVVQSIVAASVTLVLALFGGRYWALALGTLAGQTTLAAMVVARRPIGLARPDFAVIGEALGFSRQVVLERIAWFGYAGADRFIVGKVLGEAALGFYSVAQTLGMLAVEKISVLVFRVAPAVLSAVQQQPAELRRYLLSMTEVLALATFPVSIGLVLVADDVVHLLLGEQWAGTTVALELLGIVGAYQSICALLTRVLSVVGEVRLCMIVAWGTMGVLVPCFLFATRWGVAGVALVWVCVFPLTQIPLYLRLRTRIGLRLRDYAAALWPATSAVGVMVLGVAAVELAPAYHALPRPFHLGGTILVGAVLYTSTVLLVHGRRLRSIAGLLGSEARAKGSDPVEDAPVA